MRPGATYGKELWRYFVGSRKAEGHASFWERHALPDSVTVLTPATDGQKVSPTARLRGIVNERRARRKSRGRMPGRDGKPTPATERVGAEVPPGFLYSPDASFSSWAFPFRTSELSRRKSGTGCSLPAVFTAGSSVVSRAGFAPDSLSGFSLALMVASSSYDIHQRTCAPWL